MQIALSESKIIHVRRKITLNRITLHIQQTNAHFDMSMTGICIKLPEIQSSIIPDEEFSDFYSPSCNLAGKHFQKQQIQEEFDNLYDNNPQASSY